MAVLRLGCVSLLWAAAVEARNPVLYQGGVPIGLKDPFGARPVPPRGPAPPPPHRPHTGPDGRCTDDPAWRNYGGDGCAAYRPGGGGARASWCGKDGQGAEVACPVTCGTCNLRRPGGGGPWELWATGGGEGADRDPDMFGPGEVRAR